MRGRVESYYHYIVSHDGQRHLFREYREVHQKFGIGKTSFFRALAGKPSKKWAAFAVERCRLPVYKQVPMDHALD